MEVLGSSRGLAQGVLPWKHRGRGGRNGGILSLTHGGRAAMWARVYTHTHTCCRAGGVPRALHLYSPSQTHTECCNAELIPGAPNTHT